MSLDPEMEEILNLFFEESLEGLDTMESGLLTLEDGTDRETINNIFRAAHSIKGGAGTFGFMDISEFTHSVETLLDEMRNGTRSMTPDALQVLLQSVDVMRAMTQSAQLKQPIDTTAAQTLSAELSRILAQESAPESAAPGSASVAVAVTAVPLTRNAQAVAPSSAAAPSGVFRGWRIGFVPDTTLFKTCNDPLRIFDELANLGALDVTANLDRVPSFGDIDPTQCYLSWNLVLHAPVEHARIAEVFDWVDASSTITYEPLYGAADAMAHVDSAASAAGANAAASCTAAHRGASSSQPGAEATPPIAHHAASPTTAATAAHPTTAASPANPTSLGSPGTSTNLGSPATPTSLTGLASPTTPANPTAPATPASCAAATASASLKSPAGAADTQPAATGSPKAGAESGSLRVATEKVDALINLVGELVITQSMLGRFAERYEPADIESLRRSLAQLTRNTRELQESVMQIRMLPIGFSFNRFPRLVHDLSRKLGKKVELKVSGENTELDKTVLEKIGDPLVHLVRNALDHGLETPDKRLAAGKSETGTLELNAFHEGGNIIIEVKDDGGGLNKERILAKARERGLIDADTKLTDDQVYNLIFVAGFSTAETVSDVSGRGVGMDVVKRNINDLGGHVQIFSDPGCGSTIRIRLPLTLAILEGQMLRVGKEIYVASLVSIIETVRSSRENLSCVAGRTELFKHRTDYLPIIRLHDLFGIEPDSRDIADGLLVVLEADGRRVAMLVDELLAQQQVVIKSLETNFKQVPGLAGATIHGDGTVALILDVPGLIRTFLERQAAPLVKAA